MAEALPYADADFDLVVTTTSFDHWRDQRAGLAECGRVLVEGGHLVLTDQISNWLVPTLVGRRRTKARTRHRVEAALRDAGLRADAWHRVMTIIGTVVATKCGTPSPAAPAR